MTPARPALPARRARPAHLVAPDTQPEATNNLLAFIGVPHTYDAHERRVVISQLESALTDSSASAVADQSPSYGPAVPPQDAEECFSQV